MASRPVAAPRGAAAGSRATPPGCRTTAEGPEHERIAAARFATDSWSPRRCHRWDPRGPSASLDDDTTAITTTTCSTALP